MQTRLWCVAVVLVVARTSAAGQTILSEADALARLSVESPRVRAIQAATDVARAEALAAARWPNPRVTFDRESVSGLTEDILTVAQPLPLTGRRGLERDAALLLQDATASRTDEQLRRARADLRIAFADLRAAQIRERELARSRDRLQDLAGILGTREAAGDAAGFDRLRAEREVLDVEADLSLAAADRARAQAALASFFDGSLEPSQLAVSDASVARVEWPGVEALVMRASVIRGELEALRQEMEAARLAERAAGRRAIPEPEIAVGTKSSTIAGGGTGSVVIVQASLPLFDRGRPERELARAKALQAEARADAFRIALRSQITALRGMAVERREAAERYRTMAMTSADQVERIAQVSYEAGERGILELLDAHRSSAAARVRQAALDAAARQAEIELEFVSGWEIP